MHVSPLNYIFKLVKNISTREWLLLLLQLKPILEDNTKASMVPVFFGCGLSFQFVLGNQQKEGSRIFFFLRYLI